MFNFVALLRMVIMNIWQSIILGVVEGLTEFLPVSSTGHLILTARLLGLEQSDFLDSFTIGIQLGAILAIIFIYTKRLIQEPRVWVKLFFALLPSAIIGLILHQLGFLKLLFNPTLVSVNLVLGGFVFLWFHYKHHESPNALSFDAISYKKAFQVGCFQILAMMPGVSRSASTIIGGVVSGLNRKAAVEFSFLLALPTMFAATGLELYTSGLSEGFTETWHLWLAGFVCSFIFGYISVVFFLKYFLKNSFHFFGFYRILVGVLFFIFMS
jgi:undecaprenyl-diphosphatase